MHEIVIKLSDEEYEALQRASYYSFDKYTAYIAMKSGITLPKRHNRLIETTEDLYQEIRKWCGGDMAYEILTNAPTVIAADKE